jgi:L-ribulose-5-phosphate 3-epimerase
MIPGMSDKKHADKTFSRRTALGLLGGAAMIAGESKAQQAAGAKPARRPLLCVYSGNLAKIPYGDLAGIVRQMGYDGVDLTVMKGGHVDPAVYNVDLSRAFETVHDAGLELPMVTTSFTSPSQPYAYAVLYVSGLAGARFCRLGTWPPSSAAETQARGMLLRNELLQFALTGNRCKITPLMANHAASFPGRDLRETDALIAGLDPKVFGYCFDPAQSVVESRAADGWQAQLHSALPRLGAIALNDVTLDAAGATHPCPLGQGVIDWKEFFSVLAASQFSGPLSLHMDYQPPNEVTAMEKDLAFARSMVDEIWKT